MPPPASEGAGAGAIQKAFSPQAAALALPALPDADGTGAGDGLRLSLPPAVAARLRSLLDRHESGKTLTAAERAEAQGLLDIAEYFAIQTAAKPPGGLSVRRNDTWRSRGSWGSAPRP